MSKNDRVLVREKIGVSYAEIMLMTVLRVQHLCELWDNDAGFFVSTRARGACACATDELLQVLEKFDDGWWNVKLVDSDRRGIVPASYCAPEV